MKKRHSLALLNGLNRSGIFTEHRKGEKGNPNGERNVQVKMIKQGNNIDIKCILKFNLWEIYAKKNKLKLKQLRDGKLMCYIKIRCNILFLL